MALFTDQLNRTIEVSFPPKRIVSLVPSQTELLHYFGLSDEVIGITKFCVHPTEWFQKKERIGGTKNLNIKKIVGLKPNLIIANKEENTKEQIEELATFFPVWISDVNTLSEAYKMIVDIGSLTGKEGAAQQLVSNIKLLFSQYRAQVPIEKKKAAYLIWKDPYMTVGGDTFIHTMMHEAPFENVFAHQNRYPQVTVDDLKASNCEFVLLSSEPYPFAQKHADELSLQLPGVKILLVDGELFSWYGSRLLQAPLYFEMLQQMAVD